MVRGWDRRKENIQGHCDQQVFGYGIHASHAIFGVYWLLRPRIKTYSLEEVLIRRWIPNYVQSVTLFGSKSLRIGRSFSPLRFHRRI
jgi:hypothetical protein